eukprot:Skav216195  [mRNA]  locus=scaffold1222:54644:55144:- [translate_table: standard]
MAGRPGLDTKDAIENYRATIHMENRLAREWVERWGFFKAPQRRFRSEMRKEKQQKEKESKSTQLLSESKSTSVLEKAAQEVLVKKWPPPAPEEDIEFINDRHRLMHRKRLLPQQRYSKPNCTSHYYGWKPTIEKYGVAQHGVRKLEEGMMPDDINCTMMHTLYAKK